MTTLKKLETPEQRDYWEFIERTAQQSQERRPEWAPKIEQDDEQPSAASSNDARRQRIVRRD